MPDDAIDRAHRRPEAQDTEVFGDSSPCPSTGSGSPSSGGSSLAVGATVGKIRIIDRIAVGGMGEIYIGYDEKLKRKVAVKALRADRLTSEARARLLREARILSRLNDPKICQIYDYIEGPENDFLVLELIEGQTLTEALDGGLEPGAKMQIAEQLVDVLVKAHAKGVVHRDLKPANIMLTTDGRIKVLDFGLAYTEADERTLQSLSRTDESSVIDGSEFVRTRLGRVMGTISFMSPEQAWGQRATTAGDMYAFGLLLQTIFTGEAPYDPDLPQLELLKHARRGETRPIVGADADLSTLVEQLKSLTPEARPSAADTASRLRWIRGKRRRRWRWAAVIALVLSLGLASLKYTLDLRRERNAALASEAQARAATEEAEEVVAFLEEIFAVAAPERARGEEITARELLDQGADRITRELAGQPVVQARLMSTIGYVYYGLGLFDQAEKLLRRALEIRQEVLGEDAPEVADSARRLADLLEQLDGYDEATDLLEQALIIDQNRLGPDHPDVAQDLFRLADIRQLRADYEGAEPLARRALEIQEASLGPDHPDVAETLHTLAILHRKLGHWTASEDSFRRALEILEHQRPGQPVLASTLYEFAVTHAVQGRYDQAEPLYQRALELRERVLGPEHRAVADSLNALAILHRRQGRPEQAIPLFQHALEIWEKSLGPEHINIGHGTNNLASVYLGQGSYLEAERLYRRSLAIFEHALGTDHPYVAMSLGNLGTLLWKQGRNVDAEPVLRRALAIDEQAVGLEHPHVGSDLYLLANVVRDLKRYEEAEALYRRSLAILASDAGADPDELSEARRHLAELLRTVGRGEEAAELESAAEQTD